MRRRVGALPGPLAPVVGSLGLRQQEVAGAVEADPIRPQAVAVGRPLTDGVRCSLHSGFGDVQGHEDARAAVGRQVGPGEVAAEKGRTGRSARPGRGPARGPAIGVRGRLPADRGTATSKARPGGACRQRASRARPHCRARGAGRGANTRRVAVRWQRAVGARARGRVGRVRLIGDQPSPAVLDRLFDTRAPPPSPGDRPDLATGSRRRRARELSNAGWGLLAADFLTPHYDISFTNRATSFPAWRGSPRLRMDPGPYRETRLGSAPAGQSRTPRSGDVLRHAGTMSTSALADHRLAWPLHRQCAGSEPSGRASSAPKPRRRVEAVLRAARRRRAPACGLLPGGCRGCSTSRPSATSPASGSTTARGGAATRSGASDTGTAPDGP